MTNNNLAVLRELNRHVDSIFKLVATGMYAESARQASIILNLAKERLSPENPYLQVYLDIYTYTKNLPNSFRDMEKVNTSTNNSIDLNNIESNHEEKILFQLALKEAENELSRSRTKFRPDHPYMIILEKNITSMKSQLNINSSNVEKNPTSISIIFLIITAIFSLIFVIVFGVSIVIDILPTKTINLDLATDASPSTNDNFTYIIKESNIINAPSIQQYPELPRGCEVTSLAMLLQYSGVKVDKMTLAKEIQKDPASYKVTNGQVHFGNPEYGFVGNMYSLNEPGLGVYHEPIHKLAEQYLPNQTIDLTGREFNDLLYFLSNDIPVWVVTNTTFSQLNSSYFEEWQTASGPISITYKQHSVLLTGYDDKYIYFNDPLRKGKNQKEPKASFIKAWEQMGSQAITYIPADKSLFEIIPIEYK